MELYRARLPAISYTVYHRNDRVERQCRPETEPHPAPQLMLQAWQAVVPVEYLPWPQLAQELSVRARPSHSV